MMNKDVERLRAKKTCKVAVELMNLALFSKPSQSTSRPWTGRGTGKKILTMTQQCCVMSDSDLATTNLGMERIAWDMWKVKRQIFRFVICLVILTALVGLPTLTGPSQLVPLASVDPSVQRTELK